MLFLFIRLHHNEAPEFAKVIKSCRLLEAFPLGFMCFALSNHNVINKALLMTLGMKHKEVREITLIANHPQDSLISRNTAQMCEPWRIWVDVRYSDKDEICDCERKMFCTLMDCFIVHSMCWTSLAQSGKHWTTLPTALFELLML